MSTAATTEPTSAQSAASNPGIMLWDRHFRDPVDAREEALALLDDPSSSPRTRGWAELTLAYSHLFFSSKPLEAEARIGRARALMDSVPDRRGQLLAEIAAARLLILQQAPVPARQRLLDIRDEALALFGPEDRFWLLNALGATFFYSDQVDEAIRYIYQALEQLRSVDLSPQLPTVMSNLAASLITVGDYAPAKELAQDALDIQSRFNNPQIVLYARSNLAECLQALGDHPAALATVENMLGDASLREARAAQNNYCAVAAEVYAFNRRFDDAEDAVTLARKIFESFPGGFNEVQYRWAEAVLAMARTPGAAPLPALEAAIAAAVQLHHLPTLCKAYAAAAQRYGELGRFEEAFERGQRLLAVTTERLTNRASVKYDLLKFDHELRHARAERDRAERQRRESEALNRQLERLNNELSRKVREVEELQSRLASEAVHDPLTQLFNRRYLDSVVPALLSGAARRGASVTVALLDLDRFKRVNDVHGHLAGDKVLMQIGRLFSVALRPSDVVCRYGGEEFCVVLPDTDGEGARVALGTLSERLRDTVVDWGGEVLSGFTFSAGVAVFPDHGETLAELISIADRALYNAKGAGRDRVIVAPEASAMAQPLRHFLQIADFSRDEIEHLFLRTRWIKDRFKRYEIYQPLRDRTLAMVFEKASTRTRVSFEAGMNQLGGIAINLNRGDTQLARGEPIEDVARVISRMVDVVMIRTFEQTIIERFAEHSRVPVINGLTNEYHPCQILADMYTFVEQRGSMAGRRVAWIGDANNMFYTWLQAAKLFDFALHVSSPAGYAVDAARIGAGERAHLTNFDDPNEACRGADLVTTDVWTSMGYEAENDARLAAFADWQVDAAMMTMAKPDALFMHCLPAHRGEEVAAEVIDGPQSVVWDEAENRMHAQKALLEYLLCGRVDERAA